MQRPSLKIILSLLLLTPAVLSEINVDLNYDEDLRAQQSKRFDVKSHFQIKCSVTGDDSVDAKWHKGSTEVKPSERVSTSKQGTVFSLNVKHATEEDAGNYECVVFKDDSEVKRANITLVSKVYVKMVANLNFVEGEAIKMVCQVVGSPTVTWMVGNETYDESRDRVLLEKDPESNVENTMLVIKEAQMSDRTEYKCMATNAYGDTADGTTMVRIKDKYAALWPFLGICAEVFVLCAIILIYEKKRNKTELEESDTDQSPDQKH
ncbi:basigin isoform X2 [Atheta coriaria]|uniref:basigin isoform X2 n=1 Tax=Dalotia coriaria TaxID=877792 RepID=UPI0031F408E4